MSDSPDTSTRPRYNSMSVFGRFQVHSLLMETQVYGHLFYTTSETRALENSPQGMYANLVLYFMYFRVLLIPSVMSDILFRVGILLSQLTLNFYPYMCGFIYIYTALNRPPKYGSFFAFPDFPMYQWLSGSDAMYSLGFKLIRKPCMHQLLALKLWEWIVEGKVIFHQCWVHSWM